MNDEGKCEGTESYFHYRIKEMVCKWEIEPSDAQDHIKQFSRREFKHFINICAHFA